MKLRDQAGYKYAKAIRDGKIPAGEPLKHAVKRFFKLVKETRKGTSDYKFDLKKVEKFYEFVETFCTFQKRPVTIFPSQHFLILQVLGIVNRKTGLRKFKRLFLVTSKGSGKSSFMAIMLLYLTICEGDYASTSAIMANTDRQAQIPFRIVGELIDNSLPLRMAFGRNVRTVSYMPLSFTHKKSRNLISKLSGSGGQSESYQSRHSGIVRLKILVVEEMHELNNKALIVMQSLWMNTKDQPQPLLIQVSNAPSSLEDEFGILYQEALDIAAGKIPDETALILIYSQDEEDEWELYQEEGWEKLVEKSNPNVIFGSPSWDYLRQQLMDSERSPSKRYLVARLCFSVRTSSEVPFIDLKLVEEAFVDEKPTYISVDNKKPKVYASVDLASVRDFTSLAFCFDYGDYRYVETYNYCLKKQVEALEWGGIYPMRRFIKDGYLETVDAELMDYDIIASKIKQFHKQYKLEALSFDSHRIRDFKAALQKQDILLFTDPNFVSPNSKTIPGVFANQSSWRTRLKTKEMDKRLTETFSPQVIDNLEQALKEKSVKILRNPLIVMAFQGVEIDYSKRGDRAFLRKGKLKIDSLVALAQSHGLCMASKDYTNMVTKGVVSGISKAME